MIRKECILQLAYLENSMPIHLLHFLTQFFPDLVQTGNQTKAIIREQVNRCFLEQTVPCYPYAKQERAIKQVTG